MVRKGDYGKILPYLDVAKREGRTVREALLRSSSLLTRVLAEIAANLLHGNVEVGPRDRTRLRRYEKELEALARRSAPLSAKRALLLRKDSLLSLLLKLGIPAAARRWKDGNR